MARIRNDHRSFMYTAACVALGGFFTSASLAQTGPPEEAPISRIDRLAESDALYRQAFEDGLYAEAADATKLYISAFLTTDKPDRSEWARALAQLGEAQFFAGDRASAIQNYELAVEVIEDENDRLSEALVEPLVGLATVQSAAEEYAGAAASYERAMHIHRVNSGLHTLKQGELAAELSEVYFRIGNFERANGLQVTHMNVMQRNYPDDRLMMVPAYLGRASMLSRTGRMIDAQTAYNRIIALIEDNAGGQSIELLPAIYDYADMLANNRIVDGTDGHERAKRFLRRAVYIAEKSEIANSLDRADAYIALGDFFASRTTDRDQALRHYTKAWRELESDEISRAARHERFGSPRLLNDVPHVLTPAMQKLLMLSHPDIPNRNARLVVGYDISAAGKAENIVLIEADPTGYWDSIITRHVGNFAFRPGFADGEPQRFSNQVYSLQYSINDEDLPANFRQNALIVNHQRAD